jgi:hypothetical protein
MNAPAEHDYFRLGIFLGTLGEPYGHLLIPLMIGRRLEEALAAPTQD